MPRLARSEWHELAGDMNWQLSYVEEEQAFLDGFRGIGWAAPRAVPARADGRTALLAYRNRVTR